MCGCVGAPSVVGPWLHFVVCGLCEARYQESLKNPPACPPSPSSSAKTLWIPVVRKRLHVDVSPAWRMAP